MIWLLAAAAAVAAGELFLRLPVVGTLDLVLATSRKSARVLASRRISEHWKERVLPIYALRIAGGSLRFLFFLAMLLTPFLVAGFLAGAVRPGGLVAWSEELMRPPVMALVCAASVGWILLRRRGRRNVRRA
jgi:hypothetical protein